MIRENTTLKYLDRTAVALFHDLFVDSIETQGEPLPHFEANLQAADSLDSVLNTPRQEVFGNDLYPNLASKAAVIFYLLLKNHVFINGNKRLAVFLTVVFLFLNGKQLDCSNVELVNLALEVVETPSSEFDQMKEYLTGRFEDLLIDI